MEGLRGMGVRKGREAEAEEESEMDVREGGCGGFKEGYRKEVVGLGTCP